MSTPEKPSARTIANRANAALSTGPKTEEGKRIASHNALKTGLTGRTILLPTDDVALYQEHLARTIHLHQPETDEERAHVVTIAQIEWRLLRIPTLETGIYALGRRQLAANLVDEPADIREALLEAEVFLLYQKQLNNLYVQESRLTRQLERETAKLQRLQAQRHAEAQARIDEAAAYYANCAAHSRPYQHSDVQAVGFEFSIDQVRRAAARLKARQTRSAWPTIYAEQLYHGAKPPLAA